MTVANVKSNWVSGDLVFYDKSGNEIFNLDGTNRAMEFPTGSALSMAGTLTVTAAGTLAVAGQLTATTPIRTASPVVPASADAAIAVVGYSQSIYITKGGVCALTLANPTATTHDGARLTIIATTAHAHTVSNAAGAGFNGGGAGADVATFGGAIGDNMVVEAYQGKWYVISLLNVTLG
jgi:hypothetical protein